MKKRDLAIVNDLTRFRCMTRDQIIELHFKGLKNPITCANTVLKRLRRDGYIEVSKERQPYIYFPSPVPIKKDSTKIPHFLKIVDFYKSVVLSSIPETFIVEPKYGKGFMEPDGFMIWKRSAFFIEIQRSVYSEKVMNEKVKRYEAYHLSNEWQEEPWQHPEQEKRAFPVVILITDTRYKIDSPYVKFIQVQDVDQLLKLYAPKRRLTSNGTLELATT